MNILIVPKWIQKNDTIGVTACSGGKTATVDWTRMDNGTVQFLKRGYRVIETPDVRTEEKGRSAPATERARQLHELVKNPDVSWIIQACGGDYLAEMHDCFKRGYTPKVKPFKGCNACSLAELCLPKMSRRQCVSEYIVNAMADAPDTPDGNRGR